MNLIAKQQKTEEKKNTAEIKVVVKGYDVTTEVEHEIKKLKTPRTLKYMRAINAIDQLSENDKSIIEAVQNLPVNNKLIGILSECRIPGCITHAIDKWGNVVCHYRSTEQMNDDMRQGYEIFVQNPDCSSLEVYTFSFCVVYDDGTVKVIQREE